jgi:hypothetical protein
MRVCVKDLRLFAEQEERRKAERIAKLTGASDAEVAAMDSAPTSEGRSVAVAGDQHI